MVWVVGGWGQKEARRASERAGESKSELLRSEACTRERRDGAGPGHERQQESDRPTVWLNQCLIRRLSQPSTMHAG